METKSPSPSANGSLRKDKGWWEEYFLENGRRNEKKNVYFAAFLSQACYRSSFPAGRGVNNSHVYQHLAEAPPIRLTVGLRFKAFPSQRNIGDSPLNKKKQTKALMVQKYSVFARGKFVCSIFPSETFLRGSWLFNLLVDPTAAQSISSLWFRLQSPERLPGLLPGFFSSTSSSSSRRNR